MTEEKVKRINELAKKAKATGLSEEEKKEQAELRTQYIADFRRNFVGILDNTYIQDPDGTKTKLRRKDEK